MLVAAMAAVAVGGFVVAPRLVFALAGLPQPSRSALLPWVAVGLWAVSWHLPNPDLASTDTFTQHLVGGGVACAFLGRYLADNLSLRPIVLRLGLTLAVSAVLGVANELGELGADEFLGYDLTGDASWDLLANTLGAAVGALVIEGLRPWRPEAGRHRSPAEHGAQG